MCLETFPTLCCGFQNGCALAVPQRPGRPGFPARKFSVSPIDISCYPVAITLNKCILVLMHSNI